MKLKENADYISDMVTDDELTTLLATRYIHAGATREVKGQLVDLYTYIRHT